MGSFGHLLVWFCHVSQLHKLLQFWDAVQVELRGRYSLGRLQALQHYAQTSSSRHHLAAAMLTPLPALVGATALDMLPMGSPRLAFAQQTIWVVFRVWFIGWLMAYMFALQLHHSAPTLPLSQTRLWTLAAVSGIAPALGFAMIAQFAVFPIPFAILILAFPWLVVFLLGLYLSWGRALRHDYVARANLRCYVIVFIAQFTIMFAYSAYNILYTAAGPLYQTYVVLGLPALKMTFKNIFNHGIFHMDDLAPAIIVFNVEIFHGLFVSSTMQQAKSAGSVIVVMTVDVVQAITALVEIQLVIARIHRTVARVELLKRTEPARQNDSQTEHARLAALGLLGYMQHLLDSCARVRVDPQLTQPRHLRAPSRLETRSTTAVAPSPAATSIIVATVGGPSAAAIQHESSAGDLRLRIVQDVLKLLHMVEFYVLIEFAEVVVAAVYTLYLLAVSFLPIRAYYKPLAVLTPLQMDAAIGRVAQYTALELLTFVVFCMVLHRRLGWGISCIQQLAFVLTTHARMVQASLAMWVILVPQFSLEHFGTDFTFQFNWLRGVNGAA